MTKNQMLSLKPGDKIRICSPSLHTHGAVRTVKRLFRSAGGYFYGLQAQEMDGYLYQPKEIEHYKE